MRNFTLLLFTIVLAIFADTKTSSAAYWRTLASGSWNGGSATWQYRTSLLGAWGTPGTAGPVAGDDVIINGGHVVTVTATAACSNLYSNNGTGASNTSGSSGLTINSGISLSISGVCNIYPDNNTPFALTNNGGSLSVTGTTTFQTRASCPLTISNTGTMTGAALMVTGPNTNSTYISGNGTFTYTAVTISGNVDFNGTGTFNGTTLSITGTDTKLIRGTGAYVFSGLATMSGAATLTIDGSFKAAGLDASGTGNSAKSFAGTGTYLFTAGVTIDGDHDITISNTFTVQGTLDITSNNTRNITGTGVYSVSGLTTMAGAATMTINGSFTSGGFTCSGGNTKTLNGSGTYLIAGATNLNGAIGITVTNTFTGQGALNFTLTNSKTMSGTGIFSFTGATTMTGDAAITVNSPGTFTTTALTASGTDPKTITGTGVFTISGASNVSGALGITVNSPGTFTGTTFSSSGTDAKTITGTGAFLFTGAVTNSGYLNTTITNPGTFKAASLTLSGTSTKQMIGTGAYEYVGTVDIQAAATLTCTSPGTFKCDSIFVGGTATKTFSATGAITVTKGVSVTGDLTFDSDLSFSSSLFSVIAAANPVVISGSGTHSITGQITLSGSNIDMSAKLNGGSLSIPGTATTTINSTGTHTGSIYVTGTSSILANGAATQVYLNRLNSGGAITTTSNSNNTFTMGIDTINGSSNMSMLNSATAAALTTLTTNIISLTGSLAITNTAAAAGTPTKTITVASSTSVGTDFSFANASTADINYTSGTTTTVGGNMSMGNTNTGTNTFTLGGVGTVTGNVSMTNSTTGSNVMALNAVMTVNGSTGVSMTSTNNTTGNQITIGSNTAVGGLNIATNDLNMSGSSNAGTVSENDIIMYQGTLTIKDDINMSNVSGTGIHHRINWNDNTADAKNKSVYLYGNVNSFALGRLTFTDGNSNAPFYFYFCGTTKAQTIPANDNWNYKIIDVTNTFDTVYFGGTLNRVNSRIAGKLKISAGAKVSDQGYDFGGTAATNDSIEIAATGTFIIKNANQQFPLAVEQVNIANDGVVYFYNDTLSSTHKILGGTTAKSIPTVKTGGPSTCQVQSPIVVSPSAGTMIQYISVEAGTLSFNSTATSLNTTSGGQSNTQLVNVVNGATLDFPQNFSAAPLTKYTFGYTSTMSYSGAAQQIYKMHSSATNSGNLANLGNLSISGSGVKTLNTTGPDSVNVTRKLSLTGTANLTLGQSTYIKIVSDATATGWIGAIASTASITYNGTPAGKFIVQRYISLASDAYRDFSSPIKSMTLNDWQNAGMEFIGFTGSSYANTYSNAYYYDEATTGILDSGWVSATNITNLVHTLNGSAIRKGGWRLYQGRSSGGFTFTLADAGQIYSGNVLLNPTYTHDAASSSTADNGWNFMGNPYAAGLNWKSVYTSNVGSVFATDSLTDNKVSPSMYIYSPSSAGIDGNGYGAYNANTGTRIGISDSIIPAYQGFWVKMKAAASVTTTNITLQESNKYDGAGAFYKSDESPVLAKMTLTDPAGEKDNIAMHFWPRATLSNDFVYDIEKFNTLEGAPSLAFVDDNNEKIWVNAIPNNLVDYKMDVQLAVMNSGVHTINWNSLADMFSEFTCVTLIDNVTEEVIDLRSVNEYAFEAESGYDGRRFTIVATRTVEMNAESTVTNPSCAGQENGLLRVDLSNYQGDHSFSLYKLGNNMQLVKNFTGPMKQIKWPLPAGDYKLVNQKAKFCGQKEYFFTITDPVKVEANFTVNNPVVVTGEEVTFTNSSTGSSVFLWYFDDDNSTSDEMEPKHTYQTKGTYTVELRTANDDPNCTSAHKEVISVSQPSDIGGTVVPSNEVSFAAVAGGLKFNNPLTGKVTMTIFTVDGKLVKSVELNGATGTVTIDNPGNYVVSIVGEGFSTSKQVVVFN